MLTLMEVKCHQRSNVDNYELRLKTWSEKYMMNVYHDNDLHEGQQSNVVGLNYKLWPTKLGQKNPW